MKVFPIQINRDGRCHYFRYGPLPPYPLTPQTMTDIGTDALRLAVIERAIMDLKCGLIASRLMTSAKLAMAASRDIHDRLYNFRHDAYKFLKSAKESLNSAWCDTLGMGVDIKYLVHETEVNSNYCSELLQRPYTIYLLKGRQIIPFLSVRECMDVSLLGLTSLMPPSLLSHIREDPLTGSHTILFSRKTKGAKPANYFGIERTLFGKCPEPDIRAMYKRRLAQENNQNYKGGE